MPERAEIEAVAAELKHNDECGPGPVSEAEYLADAEAIIRVLDRVRDARGEGLCPECQLPARDGEHQMGCSRDARGDDEGEPPCDCHWRISQGYGHRPDCPMLVAHKRRMTEKYGPQGARGESKQNADGG